MKKNITSDKLPNWKEIYQLPLEYDGFNYAFGKNGVMAITFNFGMNKDDKSKIIDIINGIDDNTIKDINFKGCDFYQDKEYIFCVRGWGYLTGCGALNYSEEKAIKIQDNFIKYINDRLDKSL